MSLITAQNLAKDYHTGEVNITASERGEFHD